MANVTSDRLDELVEIYNKLKKRIIQIDEKYSLDYIDPELDMPDSLNLTKLTYKPKSEQELKSLADAQVAPTILAKQATLDKNYNTKVKFFATQVTKASLKKDENMSQLQTDTSNAQTQLRNTLVNNGLIFSTIANKYEDANKQQYFEKRAKINDDWKKQLELINQQQADAEKIYNDSCQALSKQKAVLLVNAYQKLVEQEEKLERSITKYNTSLDEKEAKYQASRARAYEAARNAAHNRAYNNAKLYMQMGEVGYRRMVEKEKYYAAQDAFYPLHRDDANTILSFDAFLVSHLGTYYDAFVDWVNTTLLP